MTSSATKWHQLSLHESGHEVGQPLLYTVYLFRILSVLFFCIHISSWTQSVPNCDFHVSLHTYALLMWPTLTTPLTLLLKHCTIHRVTFSPFLELFSTVTDIKALCYPLYVSQLRDISSLDVWLLIGLQTGGISDRTSPTLTSSAPALHRAAAQSLQYKSATQPSI